ncbi:MAG: regulatory protein RecX [Candidatus Saccharimonadales bacterium]
MKITAIKAQVKNPDRVSVYVDDKYAFSLNQQQLLEQKIRLGLEVDEAQLAVFKKASDFGKMYERVLNFITIRPRSRKEVEDYCWRKKFDKDDCQVILNKFIERGYVNDRTFAKAWVESRRLTKAVSERRLRLELRQKGVSDDIVNEVLDESEYNELTALKEIIAKKRRRYPDEQKFMQYLARQGFSYDDIRRTLSE